MTIIRGDTGWIVVDPLLCEETAAAGWKLFADTVEAKSGTRPIRAVIFSHSHSDHRSEEHTSELQSLMRISYAVFCLKKKRNTLNNTIQSDHTNKNDENTLACAQTNNKHKPQLSPRPSATA